MHLQVVFVVLFSVCCAVSVLSCVDIIRSFMAKNLKFYVLLFRTSLRECKKKKASGDNNGLSQIPSREENEIKQEELAVVHLFYLLPSTVYMLVFVHPEMTLSDGLDVKI